MRLELDMDVPFCDFVDIMKPWADRAQDIGIKWPKLDELISEPEDYFGDYKVSGKDIPRLWNSYLKHGIVAAPKEIMDHCFSDMLRESVLFLRYQPRKVVKIKH